MAAESANRQRQRNGWAFFVGLGLIILNVLIIRVFVPFTSREWPPIVSYLLGLVFVLNPLIVFALVRGAIRGHHSLEGYGLLVINVVHLAIVAIAFMIFALYFGPALDTRLHGLFVMPGDCDVCSPGPPATGAGSREYTYRSVTVSGYGSGDTQYWIAEPRGAQPGTAPVIVYLHGYGAFSSLEKPTPMLEHFARKGYLIVYPKFGSYTTMLPEATDNARKAVADAFLQLQQPERVLKPNGKVAFIGGSMGGAIALRLAGDPSGWPPIPVPDLVVTHEGGSASGDTRSIDYERIPPDVRLLFIAAEETSVPVSNAPLHESVQVPYAQKNLLVVPSDTHGTVPLVSDHTGFAASDNVIAPLDAIDWWGYWRPTEKALQEVLLGRPGNYSVFCREATPACDPVRDMGTWSDGVPVNKIKNAGDLGY